MGRTTKAVTSVETVIYQMIRDTLHLHPETIDPDVSWQEMGTESYELVELIVAIRDHFGIRFGAKDLRRINTLRQLCTFVQQSVHDA